MSIKLKALGLGLLAVLATSAFAAMNATAETGGHFVHHGPTNHATVVGEETLGTEHTLDFISEGGSEIGCTVADYHGTVAAKTVESITIFPTWEECYTTGSTTKFDVDENGCWFTFTIGRKGQTAPHHTVHLLCPTGETIEITHPSCRIHIPPQTLTGVTYKEDEVGGKKAITLESTVKNITSHYESGICVFLGTKHLAEMVGSVTVWGEDTEGKRIDITATTGPEL